MDKASDLTDAYVEVRFADFEAQRTTVCRKTLNPVWNEASLRHHLMLNWLMDKNMDSCLTFDLFILTGELT